MLDCSSPIHIHTFNFRLNNTASRYGVIYVNEDSNASIRFSTFNDNKAMGNGGALCVRDSTVIINGSMFGNNTAEVHGGALHLDQGKALISSCHFIDNHTSYAAGAIYCKDNSHVMGIYSKYW